MPGEKTIKRIVEFASHLEGINLRTLREGLEVVRLHRQLEQAIENDLANWGLTARQVEIMESLYHNSEDVLTPADLSDDVGLTRSAMTSALDSLEKLGHTVRRPHLTDRRMIAVSLTPTGRAFIEHRLPERYQRFHRSMARLTKDERNCLLNTYTKVLEFLTADMAKRDK
jgi:MarR family transcriptional repressor of emrRAB